jgi:hypothetical protein
MRTLFKAAVILVLLSVPGSGQVQRESEAAANPEKLALDQVVRHFDLTDGSILDGIAVLSSNPIEGLHIGLEEVVRNKLQDPEDRSVIFSLHLENKTLREILDALCRSDTRYMWSPDGQSINVYPRASVTEPSYLLNVSLAVITLSDVPDPDHALTPLHRQLPKVQLGYMQMGGDNTYAKPWTVTFDNLTVRQFMNRITEHIGPRSSWVWQGGKDERVFTFLRGGFHTISSDKQLPAN